MLDKQGGNKLLGLEESGVENTVKLAIILMNNCAGLGEKGWAEWSTSPSSHACMLTAAKKNT